MFFFFSPPVLGGKIPVRNRKRRRRTPAPGRPAASGHFRRPTRSCWSRRPLLQRSPGDGFGLPVPGPGSLFFVLSSSGAREGSPGLWYSLWPSGLLPFSLNTKNHLFWVGVPIPLNSANKKRVPSFSHGRWASEYLGVVVQHVWFQHDSRFWKCGVCLFL